MRPRVICEIEDPAGRWPVSDWIEKNLDKRGRAKLHARFTRIEADETVNPNWLKHYVSLSMREIRFDYLRRAIRILCHESGRQITMVLATAKDTQITRDEEQRATRRRNAIQNGAANVREYPLPGRPSRDMGVIR